MNFIDFHADTLLKIELIRDSGKNRDETDLAITPDKLSDFESTAVIFSV